MPLPPLPRVRVDVVADKTAGSTCDEGFLRLRRRTIQLTWEDGTKSREFPYDEAWRKAMDAVTIIAHYRGKQGERRVYLRSSVRPPLALRPKDTLAIAEHASDGVLWELPAGLVEEDERSEAGLRACAARELEEEVGITVPPERFAMLGIGQYPTPAVIGERIYFLHAEVDPSKRAKPTEDGSPLEHLAAIADVSLDEALALVRAGKIEDMKTEIGLRRLAELGA